MLGILKRRKKKMYFKCVMQKAPLKTRKKISELSTIYLSLKTSSWELQDLRENKFIHAQGGGSHS